MGCSATDLVPTSAETHHPILRYGRLTTPVENLSEHEHHVHSIKIEGKLYSATSDGRVPWVSVEDIAAVAARVLTAEEAPNTDYVILGPELLSYGDVSGLALSYPVLVPLDPSSSVPAGSPSSSNAEINRWPRS